MFANTYTKMFGVIASRSRDHNSFKYINYLNSLISFCLSPYLSDILSHLLNYLRHLKKVFKFQRSEKLDSTQKRWSKTEEGCGNTSRSTRHWPPEERRGGTTDLPRAFQFLPRAEDHPPTAQPLSWTLGSSVKASVPKHSGPALRTRQQAKYFTALVFHSFFGKVWKESKGK